MSDDDPFENLDPPEDREGDPFERLGDVEPDEAADEGGDGAAPPEVDLSTADEAGAPGTGDDEPVFEEEFIDDDDPFATEPTDDTGPTDSASSVGGETADDTPPSDAVSPVGEGSADGIVSPGETEDPFAGMGDRDGDPFGEGESVFEAVDVEGVDPDEVWESLDAESSTETPEGSRYVEVSKHRFCEQCEHFASPPVARCTHDEAEIIEFLDMETVRLLDCPVVAEQRRLEDEG